MALTDLSAGKNSNGISTGATGRRRRRAIAVAAAVPAILGAASSALATTYQYTGGGTGTVSLPVNGTFSTGFGASPSTFTNADVLTFNGSATNTYTATDDLTAPLLVNGLRFDGVSNTSASSINISQGGAGTSNLIQLGGTTPYINFNTSAIGITTIATNLEFQSSGFIVKSFAQASTAPDPVISGNIALDPGANLVIALSDSSGDGKAELSLTGNLSGSGNLTLNNIYNSASPSVPFPAGIAPMGNTADFGTLLLSGNNSSYSGTVNISYGRIVVNNANALGTGTVNITAQNASGGTLDIGGNVNAGAENYGTLAAGVTGITIANNMTVGGQNIGGNFNGNYSASIRNDGGNNTLSGTITLTKGLVDIAVGNGTTLTISGNINQASGITAALAKTGTGNLILTGASETFAGGLNVSGGGIDTFVNSFPTVGYVLLNNGGLTINTATFGSAQAALTNTRFNTSSTGALLLTANESNNLSFTSYPGVAIGAASGANVTVSGLFTAGATGYRLGGGGGTLQVTGTNALSGASNLTVNQLNLSAGTVLIQAPQSYTGTTTVYSGTLGFVTGGLGTGQLTLASGGIEFLDNNTTDFASASRNIILAPGTNASPIETVNAINTNGFNIAIPGQFIGFTSTTGTTTTTTFGDLRKTGLGTLTVSNAATAAHFFVNGGTLAATGTAANLIYTSYNSIGQQPGDNGALSLDNGAVLTGTGDFNIGDNGGSATAGTALNSGLVNINNSTGSATPTTLTTGALYVGKGTGPVANLAVGVLNQYAGTVINAGGQQWTGEYGTGTYNMYGGILNESTSNITIGRYTGSVGTFNVSGGTVNVTATGTALYVGESGTGVLNIGTGSTINVPKLSVAAGTGSLATSGTVNQNGGTVNISTGGVQFGTNAGASVATQTAVGVYNLNGGTLLTPQVSQVVNVSGAISGTFNFNGGTLQASSGVATLFISGLTAANVLAGGAVIENSGQNITIGQNLLHGGSAAIDGGLKLSGAGVVTIGSTSNSYTGPTNITAGTLRLAASAAVVSTVPANSVQAYYSFEDPNNLLNDTSGNQNNLAQASNPVSGNPQGNYGFSTNAPPTGAVTGTHAGSLALNGSAYLVSATNAFPTGVPTGNSAFTIGAWVDPTGSSATPTNNGIVGWGAYGTTNATNSFHLINSGTGTLNTVTETWWNDDTSGTLPAGQSSVNTWNYIAVTYDPVTNLVTIYDNGQIIAQQTPTGVHNVTAANFAVGETGLNPLNYFDGNLADLVIANTAYTPAQLELAEQNNLSGSITTQVAGGQLPFNTVVQVAATATFDLNGNNQTVGGLTGAAGGQVTLGTGSLTVNTTTAGEFDGVISGTGGLTVGGTAALSLGGVNTYSGGTLVNAGGILTVTAAGQLPSGGNVTTYGTVNLTAGSGSITVRPLGTIAIGSGGQFNVLPASNHASRTLVAASNVMVATGGLLDLSNNDLDLSGASLSTITAFVASGYNLTGGANWRGTSGITSSTAAADTSHLTALGVIQNNQGGTPLYGAGTQFDGANPGASDILVKYTYFGDANLDGKVDGSDYTLIDAGYASHGTLTGWYNGDFNYDGVIDGSDYALIDNAFNNQGTQLTTPTALVATATAQVAPTAVPEPATLGLLAVTAAGLLSRRRVSLR